MINTILMMSSEIEINKVEDRYILIPNDLGMVFEATELEISIIDSFSNPQSRDDVKKKFSVYSGFVEKEFDAFIEYLICKKILNQL